MQFNLYLAKFLISIILTRCNIYHTRVTPYFNLDKEHPPTSLLEKINCLAPGHQRPNIMRNRSF
jgi:hypothetical protein